MSYGPSFPLNPEPAKFKAGAMPPQSMSLTHREPRWVRPNPPRDPTVTWKRAMPLGPRRPALPCWGAARQPGLDSWPTRWSVSASGVAEGEEDFQSRVQCRATGTERIKSLPTLLQSESLLLERRRKITPQLRSPQLSGYAEFVTTPRP